MSAEIVNLRRVRKRTERGAAETVAERNRILHGLTKAERLAMRQESEARDRVLDGSRRVPSVPEPGGE